MLKFHNLITLLSLHLLEDCVCVCTRAHMQCCLTVFENKMIDTECVMEME